MKKIWLLYFLCQRALLIYAFYEWLGVRDSRASQLLLSFVLGAAIIAGTVFLHSRTFHMKVLHASPSFTADLRVGLLGVCRCCRWIKPACGSPPP